MKTNWQKLILPHVLAILIFIVLGFVYCSPLLQGEVVNQSDMVQVQGMTKEAKDFYEKTGEHPLWSNSMFSGMPTFLTYTGPSANKLGIVNQVVGLYLPQPVNMLFLAMLGMYILLCVMGFNYWVRLFGAVAYGFSSFNLILISVGHITEMMSMVYMAPLLAGIILAYRGKYILGAVLTALSTALIVYNNHLQIAYYTVIMVTCLVIGEAIHSIKTKQLPQFFKASLLLAIAAVLAVLPASDNLLITREYAKYSIRGSQSELTLQNNTDKNIAKGGLNIDYAYQWSMGKLETFSILIPNIYGGPASSDFISSSKTYNQFTNMGAPPQQAAAYTDQYLYWGPQPSTLPVYFGAIICFLFVLSLFLVKSRHKWWLLAVTVLAILMSWGKNFAPLNDFLFYHLPLYNKFRAPSMSMVIPQLSFVFLACWALHEALCGDISKKDAWDAVKKSLYITGGIILLLTFFTGSFLGYASPNDDSRMTAPLLNALHDDRASLLRADGIRSLVFVLITAGALWAYLKNKIKFTPLIAILGIALLFDLFQVDKRYLKDDNFMDADQYAGIIQSTQADQLILQDKTPYYRVLNLTVSTFNDAKTSYFHKSIGGYSPAKLWRYQDLIDFQVSPEINRIISRLQGMKQLDSASLEVFQSAPVLNMLNTKYFIINPNGPPVENKSALGNAWFIQHISWVPDANSEMTTMEHFDPRNIAVMDSRFEKDLGGFQPAATADTAANIQLTQYGLNELKYASSNSQDGFGVFSDIYYPAGWKAFIDGKETPILRVDYALRGLKIPAGRHEIDFKFHPDTYFLGQEISGISSIILILLVIGGLVFELLGKKAEEKKADS